MSGGWAAMPGFDEFKAKLEEIAGKARERIGDEMAGWHRVFQFVLSDGTEFYVEISGGEVRIVEGRHPRPTATLVTDPETLRKILEGEMDAMAAFLRGKMRITGNVLETVKLRKMLEAARG